MNESHSYHNEILLLCFDDDDVLPLWTLDYYVIVEKPYIFIIGVGGGGGGCCMFWISLIPFCFCYS